MLIDNEKKKRKIVFQKVIWSNFDKDDFLVEYFYQIFFKKKKGIGVMIKKLI